MSSNKKLMQTNQSFAEMKHDAIYVSITFVCVLSMLWFSIQSIMHESRLYLKVYGDYSTLFVWLTTKGY